MTTATPWQQRVISAALFVGCCMLTGGALREKICYAVAAALAFGTAFVTWALWRKPQSCPPANRLADAHGSHKVA